MYYDECTEKEEKFNGHNIIRFTCPALGTSVPYYKGDLHSIKWSCGKFVPKQNSLFDGIEV